MARHRGCVNIKWRVRIPLRQLFQYNFRHAYPMLKLFKTKKNNKIYLFDKMIILSKPSFLLRSCNISMFLKILKRGLFSINWISQKKKKFIENPTFVQFSGCSFFRQPCFCWTKKRQINFENIYAGICRSVILILRECQKTKSVLIILDVQTHFFSKTTWLNSFIRVSFDSLLLEESYSYWKKIDNVTGLESWYAKNAKNCC